MTEESFQAPDKRTPWEGSSTCCYYPCFTKEKTKAQRDSEAKNGQLQGLCTYLHSVQILDEGRFSGMEEEVRLQL